METISTLNCTLIRNDIRQCGNTTRQADFAVEQILNNKKVKVIDHTEIDKASDHLFDLIIKKLISEYKFNLCELSFNKRDQTIALKSAVLQKQLG